VQPHRERATLTRSAAEAPVRQQHVSPRNAAHLALVRACARWVSRATLSDSNDAAACCLLLAAAAAACCLLPLQPLKRTKETLKVTAQCVYLEDMQRERMGVSERGRQ
jgi:hypothetical protein